MTLGPLGNAVPGPFTTVISPACTASMMQAGIRIAPLDVVRVAPVGPHARGGKLRRGFVLRAGHS